MSARRIAPRLAAALAVLLAVAAPAAARPLYFDTCTSLYGLSPGDDLYACGVCHRNWNGTGARNPFGILVNKCNFTADASTTAGSIHLGRAWDESGKDLATYATLVTSGVYPNGQALIRESTLGAHIQVAGPWSVAATTSRPFSSTAGTYPANRLYEFGNTGPGAAK